MEILIEFRGQHIAEDIWLYGNFAVINGYNCIIPDSFSYTSNIIQYQIITETVSQFIGLTDKNGKKAYVGDIFKDERGTIRTIFVINGGFATESNPIAFGYNHDDWTNPIDALSDKAMSGYFHQSCEIIGNIHDNPEFINE